MYVRVNLIGTLFNVEVQEIFPSASICTLYPPVDEAVSIANAGLNPSSIVAKAEPIDAVTVPPPQLTVTIPHFFCTVKSSDDDVLTEPDSVLRKPSIFVSVFLTLSI